MDKEKLFELFGVRLDGIDKIHRVTLAADATIVYAWTTSGRQVKLVLYLEDAGSEVCVMVAAPLDFLTDEEAEEIEDMRQEVFGV